MATPVERVNNPISTRELERRWSAVRHAMEERGVDVLLMQSNNDFMGGYVKYFTDLPATNGYPVTVVFPKDDRMTFIGQGSFGMDRPLPPEGDGIRRGIGRQLGTPSYASAYYTNEYDAELAEKALGRYSGGTIGLLGLSAMSYALVDRVKKGRLSNSTFVDASDLVDQVKVIKSEEELALIRRTAAMQDACMDAVFKAIRPGMRDIEVAAIAEQFGHSHGSEQGILMCASGPVGTVAQSAHRHYQNRVIQEGDYFNLLIETNGPGGLYTELARTCVLGKATQEMKDEIDFVVRAQDYAVSLLTPGASCKTIWESYNDFMRANHRPPEERLYCHGQGHDMVERPLVRFDEPMTIKPNMNIACHPGYATERTYSTLCDNFLTTDKGGVRLHKFARHIVELG